MSPNSWESCRSIPRSMFCPVVTWMHKLVLTPGRGLHQRSEWSSTRRWCIVRPPHYALSPINTRGVHPSNTKLCVGDDLIHPDPGIADHQSLTMGCHGLELRDHGHRPCLLAWMHLLAKITMVSLHVDFAFQPLPNLGCKLRWS